MTVRKGSMIATRKQAMRAEGDMKVVTSQVQVTFEESEALEEMTNLKDKMELKFEETNYHYNLLKEKVASTILEIVSAIHLNETLDSSTILYKILYNLDSELAKLCQKDSKAVYDSLTNIVELEDKKLLEKLI